MPVPLLPSVPASPLSLPLGDYGVLLVVAVAGAVAALVWSRREVLTWCVMAQEEERVPLTTRMDARAGVQPGIIATWTTA